MTTKELADILRITPNAVRMMRHRGLGPRGFRRGRQVLYRRAVVEEWLAALEAADTLAQRAA
ncbi:helix-turn-helix domain-containing protein [Streptomyces thermodiastaticus]|jgi:hypothetical protein|uniref:helix-turn-helix domain-containing protein n=1 Tax=Streptomyces thermodiastaticus TaxID=44061 RepID=UPI001678B3B1|nr:helix-turn-helix domain-containing protein [Streptomyces thermodiastaticus]MCE7550871.1 helix-turn-helix domain-containing protein [Streptomyces thermodiastaticus]